MDTKFLPNFPEGPLDECRKRSNIDWKQLRIVMESETVARMKQFVWNRMEQHPLFAETMPSLSTDQQKHLAAKRITHLRDLNVIPKDLFEKDYKTKINHLMAVNEALHSFDPSFSVKLAIGMSLFCNALLSMGTERHLKFNQAVWNLDYIGAIAITEVSHGSNTKSIRTTATYDPVTEEFIVNTPDFEAAKCWIGNLGKHACIILLFANLYSADGQNHGLHGFVVQIRDPTNLKPYPGLIIGDIGDKVGLNGIDNGFIMFRNYRIPRENLLNRTGDVTKEGVYESVFSEPGKILAAALESLSAGRLGIIVESTNSLAKAAVISVRYAAIRKQFGPSMNGPEVPILDYQLHQWRILPYLAGVCALKGSNYSLLKIYLETVEKSQSNSNGLEILSQIAGEIHALVSCLKPSITWLARDGIQEAREACGGHGYLKAAQLGDLRNNHDATVTYEGDNNVLSQQASNWLLKQWQSKIPESPLGSANFIINKEKILKTTFTSLQSVTNSINFIIECYEWLLCYLLQSTSNAFTDGMKVHNKFKARNEAQVFKGAVLTKAFAEYYIIRTSINRYFHIEEIPCDKIKKLLENTSFLYGYWCLEKHLSIFYQGGFATGETFANYIHENILKYCGLLKDHAVTVADALAPPDFVLNSVIAKADGMLYKNLQTEFMTNYGALTTPDWWQDAVVLKSKL